MRTSTRILQDSHFESLPIVLLLVSVLIHVQGDLRSSVLRRLEAESQLRLVALLYRSLLAVPVDS